MPSLEGIVPYRLFCSNDILIIWSKSSHVIPRVYPIDTASRRIEFVQYEQRCDCDRMLHPPMASMKEDLVSWASQSSSNSVASLRYGLNHELNWVCPPLSLCFLKSSMIFEGSLFFHVVYLSSPNHSILFVTASSHIHLYYVLPVHSFALFFYCWCGCATFYFIHSIKNRTRFVGIIAFQCGVVATMDL